MALLFDDSLLWLDSLSKDGSTSTQNKAIPPTKLHYPQHWAINHNKEFPVGSMHLSERSHWVDCRGSENEGTALYSSIPNSLQ